MVTHVRKQKLFRTASVGEAPLETTKLQPSQANPDVTFQGHKFN